MNLKEAFRYQNFLDTMMSIAVDSITCKDHCLTVSKTHRRSKANPEATDTTEIVEVEKFFKNDDVLEFMEWLVSEKYNLTKAINDAKTKANIDLDASIESNKYRQQVNNAIKRMLCHTSKKSLDRGVDYKLNAEGNQTSYYYDVEIESTIAYDKDNAKQLMRKLISSADNISSEIDMAFVTTQVGYTPKYDVNESFEDVLEAFISKL